MKLFSEWYSNKYLDLNILFWFKAPNITKIEFRFGFNDEGILIYIFSFIKTHVLYTAPVLVLNNDWYISSSINSNSS